MRREISIVAGPMLWSDNRKSWLARVPEKLPGLTLRTVKAIWDGEITSEKHWAILELRRAVAVIETQRELNKLSNKYEAMAQQLLRVDAEFYRFDADRLRAMARENSNQNRAKAKLK
jgi:hypothetical protein